MPTIQHIYNELYKTHNSGESPVPLPNCLKWQTKIWRTKLEALKSVGRKNGGPKKQE